MKKIWNETITLAKGYEAHRTLTTQAWWDHKTGTLRIEIDVKDWEDYGDHQEVDHTVAFFTNPTRESATRHAISLMDSMITKHDPEAQRIAELSHECGGWFQALHGHEVEPV